MDLLIQVALEVIMDIVKLPSKQAIVYSYPQCMRLTVFPKFTLDIIKKLLNLC